MLVKLRCNGFDVGRWLGIPPTIVLLSVVCFRDRCCAPLRAGRETLVVACVELACVWLCVFSSGVVCFWACCWCLISYGARLELYHVWFW